MGPARGRRKTSLDPCLSNLFLFLPSLFLFPQFRPLSWAVLWGFWGRLARGRRPRLCSGTAKKERREGVLLMLGREGGGLRLLLLKHGRTEEMRSAPTHPQLRQQPLLLLLLLLLLHVPLAFLAAVSFPFSRCKGGRERPWRRRRRSRSEKRRRRRRR